MMKSSYLIRLPAETLKKHKKRAEICSKSLNQFILDKLDEDSNYELNNKNSSDLISLIRESSLKNFLVAIVEFGSVAKNISTSNSDYDLLLVLTNDKQISRNLYKIWDEEVDSKIIPAMSKGREVSPHFVNIKDNLEDIHSLWLEVAISGRMIWSTNNKTENLLYKIRLAISENFFSRKIIHGQPYWIRRI